MHSLDHQLAIDLSSPAFAHDIAAGRLPPQDWPRLAHDLGVSALDAPLAPLLHLDAGTALREERGRRGVRLAAVREDGLCRLTDGATLTGAPSWTHTWWDACRLLAQGGWGPTVVVLRPPTCPTMSTYNKVGANLRRALLIAREWCVGVAVSNEAADGAIALCADVPTLTVALDADRLPHDGTARLRALREALPHTFLLRVFAEDTPVHARALGAWRSLLAAEAYTGLVSLSWQGTGDPYAGLGWAVRELKGLSFSCENRSAGG